MGLYIDLTETKTVKCKCGETIEIGGEVVFDANITHNLGEMADKAGIYKCLWRAPENGFDIAEKLISPLTHGIRVMERNSEYFKTFDSPNGWGVYDDFMPWLKSLLAACEKHPKAKIGVGV